MDNYTLYNKIEDYLTGTLSLEETKQFEQDMSANPQLAEMVKIHRFEWDAMEVIVENDLRDKMATWQQQATPPPSVKEVEKSPFLSVFVNRRFYYGLAAAASVALLIATTIWFFKEQEKVKTDIVKSDTPTQNGLPHDTAVVAPPQYLPPLKQSEKKENSKMVQTDKKQLEKRPESVSQPSTTTNTTPVSMPPITTDDKAYIAFAETAYKESDVLTYAEMRGTRGNSTEVNALDEAGQAYDKKAFDKVIGLLGNTPVKDENFMALELLAHAYFQNKNYKAALPVFQNVLKLSGKRSQNKSEWYLLLCYLANYGQYKTDFDALAQKITTQNEHDYREQTVNLLNKVNKK